MCIFFTAAGILVGFGFFAVRSYNRLVRLRVEVENAWSDIDVQLKRRHDLVPNLVETVKGSSKHERETLKEVMEARNAARAAQGVGPRGDAETRLGSALASFFAVAEAYPKLKALDSFLQLQTTLGEIEDAIQNARRFYNASVRELNTAVGQFPTNLAARAAGISPREFFEIGEPERAVPSVKL